MEVYISNETMPEDCYTCFCYETEFNMCSLTGKRLDNIRIKLDNCPLIEIVRCGECKWWEKMKDSYFGYCHAEKHCHFSNNWEISIYGTYKADHFCSDGERRSE